MADFHVAYESTARGEEAKSRSFDTLLLALQHALDLARQGNEIREIRGPEPRSATQIHDWIRRNPE